MSPIVPITPYPWPTVLDLNKKYQFFLANSYNMSPIRELNARGRQLTVGINKAGNASCGVNMQDEVVPYVTPISTCLVVCKYGIPRWSGPVWTKEVSLPENKLQINAVGWFELLNKRISRIEQSYQDVDAAIIAIDLINHANSKLKTNTRAAFDHTIPSGLGNDVTGTGGAQKLVVDDVTGFDLSGLSLRYLRVGERIVSYVGSSTSSDANHPYFPVARTADNLPYNTLVAPRAGVYQQVFHITVNPGPFQTTQERSYVISKDSNIGQQISAMGELESGYEFGVDPLTKEIKFYVKKGTVRSDANFGYGWGPSNLTRVTYQEDGSQIMNRMIVSGAAGRYLYEDATSVSDYGAFEEAQSFTGNLGSSSDNLQAFAAGEVEVRKNPRTNYDITPKKNTSPEPFKDYFEGDTVFLTVKSQNLKIISKPIRIFQFSVTIDENGNEQVSNIQATNTG